MYRLLYLILAYALAAVAVSCIDGQRSDAEDEQRGGGGLKSDTLPQGQRQLLHGGMSDTIYEVVTTVFAAKEENDSIVKAGKPDYDREYSAFPNEDTCMYDTTGKVGFVRGIADGIGYRYEYSYEGKKVAEEKYYQNGELFYDRRYIYEHGQRINTVEELYICGEKTINEYPVDTLKVRYKGGYRIEYGDTPNDYCITDQRGNVVKESSYSEMDDYSSVIEYTYNERGWRISLNYDGEYLYTYDYTNIDAHGNWIRAVIRCNGSPYGIVERTISYY